MGRNEATKEIIEGSKIDQITMFHIVKGIMKELMMGYPAHIYWGIIEGRFRSKREGEIVIDILEQHKLIEVNKVDVSTKSYRLTSKGVNFAVSLANLDYSEKMSKFTKIIIFFGVLTFIISVNQLIFIILQYFKLTPFA